MERRTRPVLQCFSNLENLGTEAVVRKSRGLQSVQARRASFADCCASESAEWQRMRIKEERRMEITIKRLLAKGTTEPQWVDSLRSSMKRRPRQAPSWQKRYLAQAQAAVQPAEAMRHQGTAAVCNARGSDEYFAEGPLMLKDILKDEAKGPGSQVPRATESRIPETPMWLASPCPAENMVPGWNPILLEEEIEGDHTPSANAADAADVANAADVLDALDALDAADAADVEIDASPTGYTPTLEAAECNEQHEEEVISDAGWTPVEADVSPDVGRANEAPAAEIDAEIDAMVPQTPTVEDPECHQSEATPADAGWTPVEADVSPDVGRANEAPAAEIDAEIDAMVPQTPAVEDPECHQSEAIPADAEENDGAVCVALSSRSASEVPSDLTARSLAAQQMAWQAATEVHQRLYSLQQELDDVEDTPSSGSTIAACCAAELLLKVSEHLVGDMSGP